MNKDPQDRREFLRQVPRLGATMLAAQWATASPQAYAQAQNPAPPVPAPPVPAAPPPAAPAPGAGLPPHWLGKEQIAMLIYPDFTALDMVGPQYMLAGLMGATVHLVAASREPVKSDTGLVFVPSMTMAECPRDLDILFVPGGSRGTIAAMRDRKLVEWVAEQGRRAKWVSSVCTGSMVLAQAGLLRGKRATSHWVTRELLANFGAIPVDERVVWDGNTVTGAGVSAGIDLGLEVVARLRDATYAQAMQLAAEYAPRPPFNAGTPRTAPPNVHALISGRFDKLRAQMTESAKDMLAAPAQ
ncbi:MAG: DJ-1/PfpI family protein [Sterolibacterium sp.]|jgi:putative intracellular protease/amidase